MIKVVIADRMGKGQKVAKGIEEAGGQAVVVPGMGADMRLGKVMLIWEFHSAVQVVLVPLQQILNMDIQKDME